MTEGGLRSDDAVYFRSLNWKELMRGRCHLRGYDRYWSEGAAMRLGPEQEKNRKEMRLFLELLGATVVFLALNSWRPAMPRYLLICAALGVPWGIWRAWKPFEGGFTGVLFAAYVFFTGDRAAEYAYGVDAGEIPFVVLVQGLLVFMTVILVLTESLRKLFRDPEGVAPR